MKKKEITLNVYEIGDVLEITNVLPKTKKPCLTKATRCVVINVKELKQGGFSYTVLTNDGNKTKIKPGEMMGEKYLGSIDLSLLAIFEEDAEEAEEAADGNEGTEESAGDEHPPSITGKPAILRFYSEVFGGLENVNVPYDAEKTVVWVLDQLPASPRKVLKMRIRGRTLEEIGQELGVTKQRVHQILKIGQSELSKPPLRYVLFYGLEGYRMCRHLIGPQAEGG